MVHIQSSTESHAKIQNNQVFYEWQALYICWRTQARQEEYLALNSFLKVSLERRREKGKNGNKEPSLKKPKQQH